ncbi:unknown (plasmid) [Haloarcula marismortui ATCC 43049]|uniref:Uncharacterized protein n=1 Tax=Haloarcula marismortui (strain ATCC 43049 / DSM 3752 / JCM 8966 / VKM B-1809) TaxID=272569 RepID=Q5V7Y3_HALMA|nr:hypothetical protein [Haloarcula marismortui]AAV44344.1 unknown [Haloarcula marismortui ATCC 43049]
MEITVTDARLLKRLETEKARYWAGFDKAQLLVRFRAETTADSPVTHPKTRSIVAITGSSQYGGRTAETSLTTPVAGSWYSSTDDARPGIVSEGWLLFTVPETTSEAVISWSRTDESGASWTATLDAEDLPDLSIESVDAPESAPRYTDVTLTVTIENTGAGPGELDFRVDTRFLDSPVESTAQVPGDETIAHEIEVPYPSHADDEATYEISIPELSDPIETVSVKYTPPERQLGNTYTTPDGTSVTASDLRIIPSTITPKYGNSEEPPTGKQFAAAEVAFKTDSDGGYVPTNGNLYIEYDGEKYDYWEFNGSLERPDANLYEQDRLSGSRLSGGVSESGLIIAAVPEDATADELSVLWDGIVRDNREMVVRWV